MTDPPPLVLIGKVWPQTPPLPPGVLLLRDWPNAAVRAAMRRCLALVAPSVWPEPFGIVVAEALAAGRPVVASAIGGIPEIVRDGREGLLVAPSDSAALRRRAASASRARHELRDALAANATERARAYLPDAVVPRVESAYERIVRDAARSRAVRPSVFRPGTPPPRWLSRVDPLLLSQDPAVRRRPVVRNLQGLIIMHVRRAHLAVLAGLLLVCAGLALAVAPAQSARPLVRIVEEPPARWAPSGGRLSLARREP